MVSDPSPTPPSADRASERRFPELARGGALVSSIVIATLGVAASVFVWDTLSRQHRMEVEHGAALVSSSLARLIEARLEGEELNALRRWADLQLQHPPADGREWEGRAEIFLSDHPAYRAIARLEAGRPRDPIASEDGRELLRELTAKASELNTTGGQLGRSGEGALGPVRLANGRVVLGLQTAAAKDAENGPVLFAVFEPAIALSLLLERREPGYTVRVLCGGEEVYARPGSRAEDAGDAPWAAEKMRLSVGPEWSLLVQPTDVVAEGRRGAGPLVALVAGLFVSALIASLVHVSQTSGARAAALVRANVDLRDRASASARDEAEIRKLNEALEMRVAERTAVLEETISELETFNYSVSHDLRSPLGAILNFAGILSQDSGELLDEDARGYLNRISGSAKLAISLMDGLLAFSRSGREEIRKAHVDVQRLVASVRDEIATANPSLNCDIKLGDLPPAYADPAALRFIFFNLLSNACKFVRKDESPRIEVAGYVENHATVYLVRDQGVGFDMRFADKLFRVFERLHPGDEYEGHGVGLAIVARLVRRHGGNAWAEGASDKGATFYIRLPNAGGEHGASGSRYV